MNLYLWVALGSAIGGCLRYALDRVVLDHHTNLPWSTILINVVGSFVIGFFGTLTVNGSRWEASESIRIFVMIGLCGGFITSRPSAWKPTTCCVPARGAKHC